MQKSFHFVQVQTNKKNNDAKYKKDVHVQAMRAFRRQERMQRTRQYQKRISTETLNKTEEEDLGSPHGDAGSMVSTRSNSPQQDALPFINQSAYLAAEALDPFTTLSLELENGQQMLLHHFQTTIASILLPGTAHGSRNSWGSRWLEASIGDSTLLIATCAHSSAHLDMITYGQRTQRTPRLQAAAARTLNQALDTNLSDSTLGAVAMIAGDALLPHDLEEFNLLHIHVTALLKMVSMRGGIQHIGSGRFRETLQLGINLIFGPYEILSPSPHDLEGMSTVLPNIKDRLQTTQDLVAECRHLTEMQTELESATEVDIAFLQCFSDRRSALEVCLGRYLQESTPSDGVGIKQKSIERAVRLAAVLFVICILRNFHSGGILTAKTIQELIETVLVLVDSKTLHVLDSDDALYMLWATLLAYKFSGEEVWPGHFPGMLRRLLLSLQLRHVSEVHASLTQVAWSERIWDKRMTLLLEKIGVRSLVPPKNLRNFRIRTCRSLLGNSQDRNL